MDNKVGFKDLLLRSEQLGDDALFFRAVDKLSAYLKTLYKSLMKNGRFNIIGDFKISDLEIIENRIICTNLNGVREGEIYEDLGRFIGLLLSEKVTPFFLAVSGKVLQKFSAEFHINKNKILKNVLKTLGKKDKAVEIANSLVNKIIVCPDKFKGTMSAITVAGIIEKEIKKKYPGIEVVKIPVADGGDGTLDCFLQAAKCEVKTLEVKDAYLKPVNAEYIVLPNGVAVIETAKVAGLCMIKEKNPSLTSTYGIGEIIKKESLEGRKIILALGGSSTSDGGAGIAAACGVKFINFNGEEFIPTGGTLSDIDKIDAAALIKADVTCMCDVENPLYGKNGAAYVYAPQKGADDATVEMLDRGLRHYADKIREYLDKDISAVKGGGAAGGIGGGTVAFFDAKLKSGIDTMLDAVGFDKLISGANMVITGEGRLDKTSFSGKAISGIIRRSEAARVPVIAICGQVDSELSLKETGLAAAFATNTTMLLFEDIKAGCETDLKNKISEVLCTAALF